MDPALLAQLVSLNMNGKLSDEQLFNALQRGEIISEAVDFETHQYQIENNVSDAPIGE